MNPRELGGTGLGRCGYRVSVLGGASASWGRLLGVRAGLNAWVYGVKLSGARGNCAKGLGVRFARL